MDCVLVAMFMMRIANENNETAMISMNVLGAHPIKIMETQSMTNPTVIGCRVSNLETSQPDKGRPIMELMGINNNTVPNSASLKLKLALMVGMRDVQVEKQTPERKKYRLRKARFLFLSSILNWRANIH